ncbi:ShlB/FhaC/HecB family hemolysin secretion/activation protein [Ralstonia soli]|uniref:ShlB/FhaC/HecB family hemolysin secretion/activation protein n=1 Tax=Ralstonia soli TaxID=2953896 RepID=A0ABT1AG40_9RALS|nr:ShlB/FhaC/HecB family hemolysin secretion/activation protein [Ralstonia soli]MCO5397284.1 hypothetical protein [Ralstonia soli]
MKTRSSFLSLGLLASGVLSCAPAGAQGVPSQSVGTPSSGSLLQSNPILNAPIDRHVGDAPAIESAQPPATASAAADADRMHVARIEVDNVPERLKPRIDALVAPYRDREMSLTDVRDVAVQITGVLLDNGESISYAYVPQEQPDLADGVVHLRVLRGHVEAMRIKANRSLVRDRVLQRYLARGVSQTGDVQTAQDQLTRLSELPGVGTLTPVLSPGQTAGGTVLSVEADAGPRVEGAFVLDNAGSRVSGRNRVGAQINVNSPLGLGDRLQAVLYGAPDFLQFNHDSDGGRTLIGRVSYDRPVGVQGARAGVALSRVDYTLGGLYRDLGEGDATVFSLYGSYPLVRGRSSNLDVSANLDAKRMSDSLFDLPNQRSAHVLNLQLSGDRQGQLAGQPNVLQYQIGTSAGRLRNTDDWNGAQTRGAYYKMTTFAKLSQGLQRGTYLDLSINTQQASRNLDGSEKMVLGGPGAVRAYSNDTASADSGYVTSATLNVAVPVVKGLTVQAFYDRAQAAVQKFVRNGANRVTLDGYGAGVSYTAGKRATLNLSHAIRGKNDPLLGDQPRAMTWASAVIRF